jgi:hypothetical protein
MLFHFLKKEIIDYLNMKTLLFSKFDIIFCSLKHRRLIVIMWETDSLTCHLVISGKSKPNLITLKLWFLTIGTHLDG